MLCEIDVSKKSVQILVDLNAVAGERFECHASNVKEFDDGFPEASK